MQRAFPLRAGASGALCGSKSGGGRTHSGPMVGWIEPLRGDDVLEEGFVERCLGKMALERVLVLGGSGSSPVPGLAPGTAECLSREEAAEASSARGVGDLGWMGRVWWTNRNRFPGSP